jgi:hypothetical protein
MTSWLPRSILAAVFLTAVLGKVRHRDEFRGTLASLEIVPGEFLGAAMWSIVGLELTAAVAALTGVAVIGVPLAAMLSLAFAGVALRVMLRRESVACNCFGATATPLGVTTVARSALFILVAGLWAVQATGRLAMSMNGPLDGIWAATILVGTLMLGRWTIRLTGALEGRFGAVPA